MNGTCRALMIGAALTLTPALLLAEGNSLLVPALGRCTLNTVAEQRSEALAACEAFAKDGAVQIRGDRSDRRRGAR